MSITILGIESSCDETSASICRDNKVINNIIATQSIHEQYGGVVPELASRAHQKNIIPVVEKALSDAKVDQKDLTAIAYTQGPGLLGALLVGSSFAKSMAMALDIPLIPVNHLQAHVLSHFVEDPKPKLPFLCLTVSGGHTQIVLVKDHLDMQVIGQTIDDAAGEAFDKGAKLLGLPYPGGPLIDKYAMEGDTKKFSFSKAGVPDLNFSFSGIKTSLLYFLRKELVKDDQFIENNIEDLCASYQDTIVTMLLEKLSKAAKAHNINQIAIAGGVSANSYLRKQLLVLGEKSGWDIFIPKFEYCTDNAGMIAITGYYKYLAQQFGELTDTSKPRMPI